MIDQILLRRTTKPMNFTGEEIQIQDIRSILHAATFAPTNKLTQPWRFTVIGGVQKQQFADWAIELHKLKYPNSEQFADVQKRLSLIAQKSSHIIAIYMSRHPQKVLPEWEEISAVACAVHNLHLAAESLGYSGIWSTSFPTPESETLDYFGGNPNNGDLFMGFFYLGVPIHKTEAPARKSIDEVCNWKL